MKIFQHTITTSILTITLLFASSNYLSAQVSENFEFLDHTTSFNTPGAHKTLDDGIVYASHGIFSTEISLAGFDNTFINLDTINDIQLFNPTSESKISEINDSLYQIVLYDLFDYDITIPGAIVYTLCNDKIISREHVFLDEYSNYFITDYERTYTGEIWALEQANSLIQASLDFEILATYEDVGVQKIFLDKDDRLFGINPNISLFNGSDFIPVSEVSGWILDIAESGQYKFLLFEGELRRYNSDFSELLNSWSVSNEVSSFRQVEFFDDHLMLGYTDDADFIYNLDYDGNVEQVWQSRQTDTPGTISQFNMLNDSTYLVAGIYNHTNTDQSFFRSIPVNSPANYDREQVNLSSVTVEQRILEKEFLGVNSLGDSIFRVDADYDFDFEIDNQEQHEVADIDIYGPGLPVTFGASIPIHFTYEASINPQDIANFIFTERSEKSFQGITFSVPGVRHKFNIGDDALVDFISSTSNPIIQASEPIYPNPASEVLFLPDNLDIQLYAIYNIKGQKIYQSNWNSNEIDISYLSNGLFNLLVQTSTGNYSYTFVKH